WRVVELWTLSADALLATNDVGLIPWVPLTNMAGPPEPVLQQCRERIDQQAAPNDRATLLAVTQILTGLKFTDPRLLAILGGGQAMLDGSPLIQELLAQQSHKTITLVLQARFGSVPSDVTTALQAILDESKLDELVGFTGVCPDLEAFRARLQAVAHRR